MADVPEPMRHHGPGWNMGLDSDGPGYWLWAPQNAGIHDPWGHTWSSEAPPRDHWAACWQAADGEDGDFVKGASATEVLAIFPADVRTLFEATL